MFCLGSIKYCMSMNFTINFTKYNVIYLKYRFSVFCILVSRQSDNKNTFLLNKFFQIFCSKYLKSLKDWPNVIYYFEYQNFHYINSKSDNPLERLKSSRINYKRDFI